MLKADVESQAWKMYVDYVDKMLVRGFVAMVNCSMQYLLANTEPTQKDALFEAKMELYVSGECLNGCMVFGFAVVINVCDCTTTWTFI